MAVKQMTDLAAQARQRWPVVRLAILHRTGRVEIAQPSVVIAVATPHRAAAFEACRWLIDELKARVPIWKREVWDDGTGSWVDPSATTTTGGATGAAERAPRPQDASPT
jgi:molybdopterin synthase catalytic subunit